VLFEGDAWHGMGIAAEAWCEVAKNSRQTRTGLSKIFPSSVEIFHAPLGQLLASQRLTHLGNEIVHKQRLFLLSTMT
jgi:hypothetical protein